MSRWSALSDLDYDEEIEGRSLLLTRSCTRCGERVTVGAGESYTVTVLCDRCWRIALETQARKSQAARRRRA